MWRLLDLLFPPRADEIVVRDLAVDTFLALEHPQLIDYTHPSTVALHTFADPRVRATLHEAKYHGSTHAFTLLAASLYDYLHDCDELYGKRAAVLVPVPLGPKRHAARGYNQVAEVLARAAPTLELSVDTTLLARTRETTSQVGLPRAERERNMRGAFSAAHPLDPDHTYILVDDVITTGATLQAAIDTLRTAGARNILPLALAH